MAHPGGRPTEYTQEICLKTKEYLKETDKLIEGRDGKTKVTLPTIEGLALALEIHKDTIYDWETKYPEFSDVLTKLRNRQADQLINRGLNGDYNPTIAKVLLTKHGYRDSQDSDITSGGKEINQVLVKFVDGKNN